MQANPRKHGSTIVHNSLLFCQCIKLTWLKVTISVNSQPGSNQFLALFTLFYLQIKFATATRTWQARTVCSTFWNNAELPVVTTAHDLRVLPGRERLCRCRCQIHAGEPAAIFCWANSAVGHLPLLALNFNLAFRVLWLTHARTHTHLFFFGCHRTNNFHYGRKAKSRGSYLDRRASQ